MEMAMPRKSNQSTVLHKTTNTASLGSTYAPEVFRVPPEDTAVALPIRNSALASCAHGRRHACLACKRILDLWTDTMRPSIRQSINQQGLIEASDGKLPTYTGARAATIASSSRGSAKGISATAERHQDGREYGNVRLSRQDAMLDPITSKQTEEHDRYRLESIRSSRIIPK